MKKLLLPTALFISLSLSFSGCSDDDARAQVGEDPELDFLLDITSGEILDDPDGEGLILEVAVSPLTVFLVESPGNGSGAISTEGFLETFSVIFGDELPNAILTIRNQDGVAKAVPVNLTSVVFDAQRQTARFLVAPLEVLTGADLPDAPIELTNIADIQSPFGDAALFIDAVQIDQCAAKCAPEVPFNPIGSAACEAICLAEDRP